MILKKFSVDWVEPRKLSLSLKILNTHPHMLLRSM